MQYEKAIANKMSFAPVMARRMGILLVFGLLHALFVWLGDVLFTYALMGFIMIAFVRIPKKWMLPISRFRVYYSIRNHVWNHLLSEKSSPNAMMEGYADIHQIELAIKHMLTVVMEKYLASAFLNG